MLNQGCVPFLPPISCLYLYELMDSCHMTNMPILSYIRAFLHVPSTWNILLPTSSSYPFPGLLLAKFLIYPLKVIFLQVSSLIILALHIHTPFISILVLNNLQLHICLLVFSLWPSFKLYHKNKNFVFP